MRHLSIILVFTFLTSIAYAGPKNKQIKGAVIGIDKEKLAGAKIEIQGTDIVVYADFDGEFAIEKLKPGNYDLKISLVSYQDLEVEDVQLDVNNGPHLFELSSR